jgi:ParB/RepB/Spo0J family partition protein
MASSSSSVKLSTSNVVQVPIGELVPDPDQPRTSFEKNSLQALADNIKERGIQVPILVRVKSEGKKNVTIIKDGERRWRAAKLAKLKTVPVLLAHAGDASQILIDQVAVNDLREKLKPMELARALVKMRDQDKLSANEIASRMSKQGLLLTNAQIANMMKLTELPAWAQDMVNDGEIEVTAAREIAGITDKGVLGKLEKMLKQAIDWRGKVTVSDVQGSIRSAFRDIAAADLKKTESYYSDAVRFDYKKVCKGCPHLLETHGMALCMDKAGFQQHQAEAKEAGLEYGGRKMKSAEAVKAKAAAGKKLTPKQQEKLDAQKAEARAASLETKTKFYLHGWARTRIQAHLPQDSRDTCQRLMEFAAAQRPGLTQDGVYIPHHVQNKYAGKLRKAAGQHGYSALPAFLAASDAGSGLYLALATELVEQLPLTETLEVAHHLFGKDISPLWKVDADYLDLLQKAELAQVAEKHAVLPEGRKAWGACKTDELKAAILAVADQVGVPPMLARLYAELEPRDPEDLDDDDEDDDQESDDDAGDEGEDE